MGNIWKSYWNNRCWPSLMYFHTKLRGSFWNLTYVCGTNWIYIQSHMANNKHALPEAQVSENFSRLNNPSSTSPNQSRSVGKFPLLIFQFRAGWPTKTSRDFCWSCRMIGIHRGPQWWHFPYHSHSHQEWHGMSSTMGGAEKNSMGRSSDGRSSNFHSVKRSFARRRLSPSWNFGWHGTVAANQIDWYTLPSGYQTWQWEPPNFVRWCSL